MCWNCGRKAQETCSGCNIARYCGSYCQHRDWETHHQVCCSTDRRHLPLGSVWKNYKDKKTKKIKINFKNFQLISGTSSSIRYDSEDRRHLVEDRRSILEERRNFVEDRARRYSTDENRRYEERKDEASKRSEKDKDKTEVDKRNENQTDKTADQSNESLRKYSDLDRLNSDTNRNRLLPNISSQILNIDNIRRIKNHVLNRDGEDKSYAETSSKKCNALNNYTGGAAGGGGGGGGLRGSRCRPNSRSTTPVSATSSVSDSQLTKWRLSTAHMSKIKIQKKSINLKMKRIWATFQDVDWLWNNFFYQNILCLPLQILNLSHESKGLEFRGPNSLY